MEWCFGMNQKLSAHLGFDQPPKQREHPQVFLILEGSIAFQECRHLGGKQNPTNSSKKKG